MRNTIISICVTVLLVFGSNVYCVSELDKDYEKIYKLAEEGKFKAAESRLEKQLSDKRLSEQDRGRATLLLAMVYRKDGKTQMAVTLLEKLEVGRTGGYWLELGEAYWDLKLFSKAADAAKTYGDCQDKGLKADGAWLRARSEFGLKDYLGCVAWCDNFLKFIGEAKTGAETKSAGSSDQLKYLDALATEAQKLKEKARELYEIEAYGRDYAWYRKGRTAQFKAVWDEAISCYENVKTGTLKDAAGCYLSQCLAAKGEVREAIKSYEEFVKANPLGLYREEALLRLAELRYVHGKAEGETKDALKDIDTLLDMLPRLEESDEIGKLFGINDALRKDVIDKASKEVVKEDDCGNLIRASLRAETIDNRMTSPWYLPEITTRAWLMRGFLLRELGQVEEAALSFKKASTAGGKVRILSDSDTVPSLIAGVAEGAYMLPGESAAHLKGTGGRLLSYACFLRISGRGNEAKRMLELAEEAFGKTHPLSKNATLELVRAQFMMLDRDKKEADKILASLYSGKKCRELPLWPMAAFFYANSLSADPGQKNKVYGIYREIAEEEKKGEYAPRALMALAVYAANLGDKKLAIATCTELRNRYVKTPYREAAETLRDALENAEGKCVVAPIERKQGRVFVHTRTIVIPGGSKWQPDFSGIRSSDMMFYNIKCIGRDNCTVIKAVTFSLPIDEPQIPSSKGNQTSFVRAPLLFMKSLRYNFDERFPSLKTPETPKS